MTPARQIPEIKWAQSEISPMYDGGVADANASIKNGTAPVIAVIV
jgi:hypothetical protein